jgi:hypothetical protein
MMRILKNTIAGNLIIDAVLTGAWSTTENQYVGDIYYRLLDANARRSLIQLFLNEQDNKCCYCMKEIASYEVTIEHIIPDKISLSDYSLYNEIPELQCAVHKDLFNRKACIIPPVQYPHDLCHNNLLASCNADHHCNHGRGNDYIDVVVYDTAQIAKLAYEPNGSF